jgi:hypothetical protein
MMWLAEYAWYYAISMRTNREDFSSLIVNASVNASVNA